MILRSIRIATCLAMAALTVSAHAGGIVAGFDDLTLAANSYQSGPMPGYTVVAGPYGPVARGDFTTGGVTLGNSYDMTYGSWSGFAYSNTTDATTPGYLNQFSAFTGGAHSGTNYGVAFGGTGAAIDSAQDLSVLPSFALPTGASIEGLYVANTTYAALTMLDGDSFTDPFGAGSWFKLTAYGLTPSGLKSVDLYLADYRSADAAGRYVLDGWKYLDLSPLAGAGRIYFNLTSSDVGRYGMNTPAYFAVDDVAYSIDPAAVPEPTGLAMAATAAVALAFVIRRRGDRSLPAAT